MAMDDNDIVWNGDNGPIHHVPDDAKLHITGNDSKYCDLEDIASDEGIDVFKNAMYCALHLNIHSLPSKYEDLKSLICSLSESGIKIQFILLCETFLTEMNAELYTIPGYTL